MRAFAAACRRTPSVVHAFLSGFAFPVATRSQTLKLSASGHDLLAADALFGARLGFTGTPNDLTPDGVSVEYDAPAEAAIFRALTAPATLSVAALSNWTVMRVLARVAGLPPGEMPPPPSWAPDRLSAGAAAGSTALPVFLGAVPDPASLPPLRALIDVGALVTSLSNKGASRGSALFALPTAHPHNATLCISACRGCCGTAGIYRSMRTHIVV